MRRWSLIGLSLFSLCLAIRQRWPGARRGIVLSLQSAMNCLARRRAPAAQF